MSPRSVTGSSRWLEPNAVYRVKSGIVPLMSARSLQAERVNEALFGECVQVLAPARACWVKVRLCRDGYVGFIEPHHLGPADLLPTHRVTALRSSARLDERLNAPVLTKLGLNAQVHVAQESGRLVYCQDAGWVMRSDLAPITDFVRSDYVCIAERLVGTPYLWGGCTAWDGLDCSGLVQTSLHACGYADVPRDSTPQREQLGESVLGRAYRRGDLAFWKGHVAILANAQEVVHATGYWRQVVREPFGDVVERYLEDGKMLLDVRRLPDYAYA